jgi:chromosome transmission fidelity protein 1
MFSAETEALLAKLGELPTTKIEANHDTIEDELKIFYCSRTHSQITQFVNELRRVKLPPSVPSDLDALCTPENELREALSEELKHLTLGSRKNLCINSKVAKPGASTTSINEQCLELQQPSTPKEKKCPYLPNKDNEVLVNDFRDHALARIRDIEDFRKLGKKIGICPYYATRAAVKPAEVG